MNLIIEGGRVLLPGGASAHTDVVLADGIVESIGSRRIGWTARRWDARGLLVLPAIVDLHGDAFERQLMPRPGVHFPHRLALTETDRQMAANGIATAFHGLTCSWEPGLRSRDAAQEFLGALETSRHGLFCDTRVHLRFEIFNIDGVADAESWIDAGLIDLLSFNDHMSHIGEKLGSSEKIAAFVERSGMDAESFRRLFTFVLERAAEVPAAVKRLAEAAKARGLPIASHDDESREMRERYHALGSRLCEFPVNAETATVARDLGDGVILGAPNILRGGSHCGRMSAEDAIRERLCTILTSDYYYPALLHAPFMLARGGVCAFADAWNLVSLNPARAAGLSDRGEMRVGQRADLVLIDASDPAMPHVAATFVAGRPAYVATDLLRLSA